MSKKVEIKVPSEPAADSAVAGEVSAHSRLHIPRKQAVILLFALCLLVAGIVSYVLSSSSSKKNQNGTADFKQVCSDSLLAKASTAISKGDLATLHSLQPQIVSTKGYDHDINCLYVLEWTSLHSGKLDDAKKYLPAMKAVYNKQAYSNALAVDKITPTQIESDITDLAQERQSEAADEAAFSADQHQLDVAGDKAISEQRHGQ